MPVYQVNLWTKESYYVEADSEDAATDQAIELDFGLNKEYYDMIECEELNDVQIQGLNLLPTDRV